MVPGFITLFHRSSYSAVNLARKVERTPPQQLERFAEAALGTALQIDPKFMEHFLQSVCGLDNSSSDPWEIELEPRLCADPVKCSDICIRGRGASIVIEMKLNAPLEPHQDPSAPEFVAPGGYGKELVEHAGRNPDTRYIYCTLQIKKSWRGPINHGQLLCQSRTWDCLLNRNGTTRKETEGERLLYNCLGVFGVGCFLSRGHEGMKIAKETVDGLNLLISVAERFGWGTTGRKRFDVGPDYIGIGLLSDDSESLKKVSNVSSGALAWFGYEKRDGEVVLSVWLYNAKDPKGLKGRLAGLKLPHSEVREDEGHVTYQCRAGDSSGDKEWFIAALTRLAPERLAGTEFCGKV